jgi:hypothetical protein
MTCKIRPHTAVIRIYDQSGNVIETHDHAEFQRTVNIKVIVNSVGRVLDFGLLF